MEVPRALHRWAVTPGQAICLQRRLAGLVIQQALAETPRYIAGGDAAFSADGRSVIAGWVVWDRQRRAVVDQAMAKRPARFPYVPGLLSFREAPALIAAARRLRIEPDVFMLDGQGLAHPRRFGLACHVGLLLGRPSLGCAKSRLCGTHDGPADVVGATAVLRDDGEDIGRVVRTRSGAKPVYVSVGHLIMLADAVGVALDSCTGYRLPEPARLAHQLVSDKRIRGSGLLSRFAAQGRERARSFSASVNDPFLYGRAEDGPAR